MKKRLLFLALAAGVCVWGFGALEARAGNIPLTTTLASFVNPDGSSNGNYTTVQQPNELDTFSNFTYSTDPVNSPPTAANITVKPFLPPNSVESGLVFSGGFAALAGTTVDYALSYVVTAPAGFKINDAVLSANMTAGTMGGSVTITELLVFPDNTTATMTIGAPGTSSASISFPWVQSILVEKDIFLVGGTTTPSSVSFINQGFSSVPEPASLALLGIGMTGFFAFRRFLKRTSVA